MHDRVPALDHVKAVAGASPRVPVPAVVVQSVQSVPVPAPNWSVPVQTPLTAIPAAFSSRMIALDRVASVRSVQLAAITVALSVRAYGIALWSNLESGLLTPSDTHALKVPRGVRV